MLDRLIAARMQRLMDRQAVIAANIANADTPGYAARELAPDFAAMVAAGGTAPTGSVAPPQVMLTPAMRALGARAPGGNGPHTIVDSNATERKPDGNTVTLEEQLFKLGQIQADFATLTSLYRQQRAMIGTALGKGSTA